GNFYMTLGLVVFLLMNGHHALVRGLHEGFRSLPLMSVQWDRRMLDVFAGLLQSCTVLALQLAAPMLLSMLMVDVCLGVASRVVPQMNVLALGVSLRAAVGLIVLMLAAAMLTRGLGHAMSGWMRMIDGLWT